MSRLAYGNAYDVAILFSQDQDLSELCSEIRTIAKEQNRWIKIAAAFPVSPTMKNKRGIPNSDWLRIVSHGVRATEKGAPGTLEVVDAMFKAAAAVVVVLTPDDEARLKTKFRKASDPSYEKNLTGQPRPNVLFAAGRAFGSHPDVTILVQVGPIRPFSDAAGLHIVHLGDGAAGLSELATRLETAGCAVDRTGQDWLKVKFSA